MKSTEEKAKLAAYMRAYRLKWLATMTPEQKEAFQAKRRENERKQWNSHRADHLARSKRFRDKIRREVIDAYGGACVCCGEDELVFLTIDHVAPLRRRSSGLTSRESSYELYLKLRKLNHPNGYQVLCFNCNHAKSASGCCPHGRLVKARLGLVPKDA